MKFIYMSPDGTETTFDRDASGGYKLLKRYSGLAEIPVSFQTDKSPYQHGETLLDTLMNPRDVSFDIITLVTPGSGGAGSCVLGEAILGSMILGAPYQSNLEVLQQKIAALSRALSPLDGDGILYYEREDGTRYGLNCSPDNSPKLDAVARSDIHHNATLDFRAHDPFWYSVVPHIDTFATDAADFFPFTIPWSIGSTPPRKTLVNSGNVDAPVTITILGPITDPVLTNETTSKILTLDIEMAEGDRFDITTGPNNITAIYTPISTGIAENGFPYITVTSTFWVLRKGSNSILFSCSTSTAGSGASVSWSDQYAGVF